MIIRFSAFLMFALFITVGCKDSSTTSANDELGLDESDNGLAIRAVNTGTEDLEISTDGDTGIVFCYKSDGCKDVTSGGGSHHWITKDGESLISTSNDEGIAVGVLISFQVEAGSGYYEVVSGKAYRDDAGFLEFEPNKVLFTSDEFTKGTNVQSSYGDVN
ncbi:hypothetical protein ACKGJO_02655 [Gracilimonas sp. Q87]|uniref:hypothetical protein n=1 Tax=Gracilimonas sp. Q87 TaxID=3384766 RepID=UPI003983DE47